MAPRRPPASGAPVLAAKGLRLTSADGREVLDGLAPWRSACHGYNHLHILSAIEAQLRVLPNVMFGGINHEPALQLARRLAGLLPGDLDHGRVGGLSAEAREKLTIARPATLGAAARIPGITQAALTALLGFVRRRGLRRSP